VDTSAVNNQPPPAVPAPIYGVGTVPEPEVPMILVYGAPVLREPAAEVRNFGPVIEQLVQRMAAAMYRANGVGLAAPQIGVSERVLVLSGDVTEATQGYPVAFINPDILDMSEDRVELLEGCLSFPKVQVKVARPTWVLVRAQTPSGTGFRVKAEGFYARALCHEIEHLEGGLLIDHAKSFKASQIKARMAKFRKKVGIR